MFEFISGLATVTATVLIILFVYFAVTIEFRDESNSFALFGFGIVYCRRHLLLRHNDLFSIKHQKFKVK